MVEKWPNVAVRHLLFTNLLMRKRVADHRPFEARKVREQVLVRNVLKVYGSNPQSVAASTVYSQYIAVKTVPSSRYATLVGLQHV